MIRYLNQFLGASAPDVEVPEQDRIRIATCVLLLEVALVDEEFSPEERERILGCLERRFFLSPEEALALMDAGRQERQESSDLWRYTNALNERCTAAEKIQVMQEIWRIVFADGALGDHEDYISHKPARLLRLSHPQLIAAKMAALDEYRKSSE